jgi:hypothetical protein
MIARVLLTCASFVPVLIPGSAFACSACQDPRAPNQNAFLLGTIMLSLLPLCMMGGIVWFLRSRYRAAGTLSDATSARVEEPAE